MAETAIAPQIMRAAWDDYTATEEFSNTRKWAAHDEHLDGSLWAAFAAGWAAAMLAEREKGGDDG